MSFDKPAENLAFQQNFSFPFDLLCDMDRKVGLAYGAADTAEDGYAKRISYLIGPEGKIEKVYGDVKPAGHPEEVLKDLG